MTTYLKPSDKQPRCGKPLRTGGKCGRRKGHKHGCQSEQTLADHLAYQHKWRQENPEACEEHRERMMRKRRERQEFLANYKLEHGCADCGYRKFAGALDFDHLPGTKKLANVTALYLASWERLLGEIAKCEVVCANCHRERTALRRDTGAYGPTRKARADDV